MYSIKTLTEHNKGKHPGYCLDNRTNICKERKNNVCNECKKRLTDNFLNSHRLQIKLQDWCTANQREHFNYFIKNNLRKKYKDYSPKSRNILSKRQNLGGLKAEEMDLGHIYHVFEKFRNDMLKRYYEEKELSRLETDSFLEAFKKSDVVKDFVYYNILDRNFSFGIVEPDNIKNTQFNEYSDSLKSLLESENDEICLSKVTVQIDSQNISLNSIAEFSIKTKLYNSLSEQIETILTKIKEGKHEIPNTNENIGAIEKYKKIITYIEGLSESHTHIANSYITNILKERKIHMQKAGIDEEDIFIATNKNPQRATEKIIRDYNGDLSRLRDVSRASFKFDTILDLQHRAVEFVEILHKYNKSEKNQKKQVTEICIESSFGYPWTDHKKNSGYRDAKFLIKLGDGNVIEIQLHIKLLFEAKKKGISQFKNKSLQDIISELNFTEKEQIEINNLIDSINRDPSNTPQPPYLNKIKNGDTLSSDQIYSIYRLLNTYDRENHQKPSKNISERSILEKLQALEREINNEGYRLMIDKMFGIFSEKTKEIKKKRIEKSLGTIKTTNT